MGFECCYPGVKDANVMRNDQHSAEYNVFVPLQNPTCCAPLFYLLPWKKSGSLASSKPPLLRKISEMKQTLPGPFSLNGCITTSDSHKVSNYFTSLHLFTKIVSMGCNFQKYTHLRIPKMQLISWERVKYFVSVVQKRSWFSMITLAVFLFTSTSLIFRHGNCLSERKRNETI